MDPIGSASVQVRQLISGVPRPTLFVVVDTEEEFAWTAPVSRENASVRAMAHVDRVQRIFDRYGVVPTYVVDYPIVSRPEGYSPLLDAVFAGRAAIGAHLHPWVNPPFEEEICRRNTFACNLDEGLERRKISQLGEQIEATFGRAPRVYKAGRYGFADSTARSLETLGFDADVSVIPHMDFTAEGGPSFTTFDARPFWFGVRRQLLEVPCTVGYAGVLGERGRHVHDVASARVFAKLRAVGVLAKLHMVNKIMLSPEGNSLAEMRALTRALIARGINTLSLTFHSPSVEPGHTPYVRSAEDLAKFLRTIDAYLEFFLAEMGGTTMSVEQFKQDQEAAWPNATADSSSHSAGGTQR